MNVGHFVQKGNNTMKISKSQLRELIKEEIEANMKEGMFSGIGAKISDAINQILLLPGVVVIGALLGYIQITLPREDFDLVEMSKNTEMMRAFSNLVASRDFDGTQFAVDWHKMNRDELVAKYFTTGEGPFGTPRTDI
tara:strand:- start:253 stop:666 length:414 start_codon:yes stop_codon:yes gene_type:complete